MKAASPYLTTHEAAVYLGKVKADGSPNLRAFSDFRRKLRREGRELREFKLAGKGRPKFKQIDLDRLYEEVRPAAPVAVPGALRGLRAVQS